MRDYVPYYTEDGSVGLYSYADNDVFHSKFGALTEAWEKFIIPAKIKTKNRGNINVLDICYGIGYNTKALMSYVINNDKDYLVKRNLIEKIFFEISNSKIFKKMFCLYKTIETIDDNNRHDEDKTLSLHNDTIQKKKTKKVSLFKKLFSHIDTIEENNLSLFNIDCLDLNEELIKLSPLFKTIKTPNEKFDDLVPKFFAGNIIYDLIREFYVSVMSWFLPKNTKEIKSLLNIKYKRMYLNNEYKIHPYVNYILINKLTDLFFPNYMNKQLRKIIFEKHKRRFFSKKSLLYAKFNYLFRYKTNKQSILSAFLHNIYYRYLSFRNKNIDFKTVERLFNINFFIEDARKTILESKREYDYIFLDAFTYTKAPQLWTVEFIAELYKRIKPEGLLLTYSNSAQIRKTLLENNFYVGKIYNKKLGKFVGTIASKDKKLIKYPLTNYEIGLCNTKAGIPYHDKALSATSQEILKRREIEFKSSSLMSSSRYMRLREINIENDEV